MYLMQENRMTKAVIKPCWYNLGQLYMSTLIGGMQLQRGIRFTYCHHIQQHGLLHHRFGYSTTFGLTIYKKFVFTKINKDHKKITVMLCTFMPPQTLCPSTLHKVRFITIVLKNSCACHLPGCVAFGEKFLFLLLFFFVL